MTSVPPDLPLLPQLLLSENFQNPDQAQNHLEEEVAVSFQTSLLETTNQEQDQDLPDLLRLQLLLLLQDLHKDSRLFQQILNLSCLLHLYLKLPDRLLILPG